MGKKVVRLDSSRWDREMEFLAKNMPERPLTLEESCPIGIQMGAFFVFLKPQEVLDLDIGFDEEHFYGYDLDEWMPFSVDYLCAAVKRTTVGVTTLDELEFPVPNSDCKVYVVININGIYCKLNRDEWNALDNFGNLRPSAQVKVFQRLLNQKLITMNDLAAADIDTQVYKRLCLNEDYGQHLCNDKLARIILWIERQQKSPKLSRMYKELMKVIDVK